MALRRRRTSSCCETTTPSESPAFHEEVVREPQRRYQGGMIYLQLINKNGDGVELIVITLTLHDEGLFFLYKARSVTSSERRGYDESQSSVRLLLTVHARPHANTRWDNILRETGEWATNRETRGCRRRDNDTRQHLVETEFRLAVASGWWWHR